MDFFRQKTNVHDIQTVIFAVVIEKEKWTVFNFKVKDIATGQFLYDETTVCKGDLDQLCEEYQKHCKVDLQATSQQNEINSEPEQKADNLPERSTSSSFLDDLGWQAASEYDFDADFFEENQPDNGMTANAHTADDIKTNDKEELGISPTVVDASSSAAKNNINTTAAFDPTVTTTVSEIATIASTTTIANSIITNTSTTTTIPTKTVTIANSTLDTAAKDDEKKKADNLPEKSASSNLLDDFGWQAANEYDFDADFFWESQRDNGMTADATPADEIRTNDKEELGVSPTVFDAASSDANSNINTAATFAPTVTTSVSASATIASSTTTIANNTITNTSPTTTIPTKTVTFTISTIDTTAEDDEKKTEGQTLYSSDNDEDDDAGFLIKCHYDH